MTSAITKRLAQHPSAKEQRLCGAAVKSCVAGLKDYMTGMKSTRLIDAARQMNKAALCVSTISLDLVSKEAGGIRSKITPLSEAYLGTVSEDGDHWGSMFGVSMKKDAIRGKANVMGMRLMQGSPSNEAEQITSGSAKMYQHPAPCRGL